jgi:hypothetical protein
MDAAPPPTPPSRSPCEGGADTRSRSDTTASAVDRRLAHKNLRTGLIAGAIAILVFALSWVVGLVY